ncbi:MAG: alcohol dehydrogenase catalytic domain-containing protein [Planctomycetes bacterium]|nr:alcohol dehydrogenase catalytic domain-containing protein [Planctomycetota bacterium]
MTALCFDGRSVLVVAEREPPALLPGEARIRMRLAGVCGTDLEIARGYLGFRGVLGHEFVGDVVEAASPGLQGARVVGAINCACQRCDFCNRGLPNHCSARTVLGILGRDGAFQDAFNLPERNLFRVPDAVPDEHAVFAEPLAAACRVTEQVDIAPWQRVAVLGDGRMGVLCAYALAERSHSVTLFGRHPGRVPFPISVEEKPVPEKVRDRFAVVVEATGSPEGLAIALRLVEPLGTVVLKSTCAAPHGTNLAPIVIDEVTVVGSRCGSLPAALELLAASRMPLAPLISARYPLAEGAAALARAAEPGVLKVLIQGKTRS